MKLKIIPIQWENFQVVKFHDDELSFILFEGDLLDCLKFIFENDLFKDLIAE